MLPIEPLHATTAAMRRDGRKLDELRPIELVRGFTRHAAGSVLIRAGGTHVLCTACIEEEVPKWRQDSGQGWLTAEYDMLPGSTQKRRDRARSKVDGRTHEIQRLVGRSIRAVVDLARLGPRTIYLDCDVLQADGGTRTAAITGAYVALCDAVAEGRRRGLWNGEPVTTSVAAVSVGVIGGRPMLDLDYSEDVTADVDCNLVMTGHGRWVEVQSTGEKAVFSDEQLAAMMSLGRAGIERLFALQKAALATS